MSEPTNRSVICPHPPALLATVMDFATTWVVVAGAATVHGLASFGFVVGPFVYLGYEKAWDCSRAALG